MPAVRRQNAPAAFTRDGIERFSAVLSEVPAGNQNQRQKFYHQNASARREDAVLTAKPVTRCVFFMKGDY